MKSGFRKAVIFLISVISAGSACADVILLRNGEEVDKCTVTLVNDVEAKATIGSSLLKKLSASALPYGFLLSGKTNTLTIPLKDIYMIGYEKRGNMYIKENGTRVSGENQTVPNDAAVIYLVAGRELIAYDVKFRDNTIDILSQKPNKKKFQPALSFAKEDVFKIKYPDGTSEIVTPLVKKIADVAQEEPDTEPAQQEEPVKPEYKVIFHTVGKKETLAAIAKRYAVEISDIIEWNDLPANTKPSAILPVGKDLMIYVSPSN